jgi:hypothetical protein
MKIVRRRKWGRRIGLPAKFKILDQEPCWLQRLAFGTIGSPPLDPHPAEEAGHGQRNPEQGAQPELKAGAAHGGLCTTVSSGPFGPVPPARPSSEGAKGVRRRQRCQGAKGEGAKGEGAKGEGAKGVRNQE